MLKQDERSNDAFLADKVNIYLRLQQKQNAYTDILNKASGLIRCEAKIITANSQ